MAKPASKATQKIRKANRAKDIESARYVKGQSKERAVWKQARSEGKIPVEEFRKK